MPNISAHKKGMETHARSDVARVGQSVSIGPMRRLHVK